MPGEDIPDEDVRTLPAEHVAELEVFFKELAPRVSRYAVWRTSGDHALAEDLTMQAFEAAAWAWGTLRTVEPRVQAAWLNLVVRRRHFSWLRRLYTAENNKAELASRSQLSQVSTEDLVVLGRLTEDMDRAIEAMPARRQQVARLKWHRWMGNEQIAQELGMTTNGVTVHVAHARQDLRQVRERYQLDDWCLLEGGTEA